MKDPLKHSSWSRVKRRWNGEEGGEEVIRKEEKRDRLFEIQHRARFGGPSELVRSSIRKWTSFEESFLAGSELFTEIGSSQAVKPSSFALLLWERPIFLTACFSCFFLWCQRANVPELHIGFSRRRKREDWLRKRSVYRGSHSLWIDFVAIEGTTTTSNLRVSETPPFTVFSYRARSTWNTTSLVVVRIHVLVVNPNLAAVHGKADSIVDSGKLSNQSIITVLNSRRVAR